MELSKGTSLKEKEAELNSLKLEKEETSKRIRELEYELEELTKEKVVIGSVRRFNMSSRTTLIVILGVSGSGDQARAQVIRVTSERNEHGYSLHIVPEDYNLDVLLTNSVDLPLGREAIADMLNRSYGRMFPSCSLSESLDAEKNEPGVHK